MKLRIADRILVAIAGLILIACCAGIVAQMFFETDLVALAGKVFSKNTPEFRVCLIALAAILFLLGLYCILVLFRHRRRRDKFILQKTDNGELAISLKALENLVAKCLEQHDELTVQSQHLENQRDGLLIRIRGTVAGGISIPLTVETLQKQIKQYVTACSGVEVKGIQVRIEDSGEDAKDAPFAIEAPAAMPLLRSAEKQPDTDRPQQEEEPEPKAAFTADPVTVPADVKDYSIPIPDEDDTDDRPLHQRLFSPKAEPCIVPEPPKPEETASDPVPDQPDEDRNGPTSETEPPAEKNGTEDQEVPETDTKENITDEQA